MSSLEEPACNVCGESKVRTLFTRESNLHAEASFVATTDAFQGYGQVVECVRCGLARLSPRQQWSFLRQAYQDSKDPLYLAELPGRLATARKVLRCLEKYVEGERVEREKKGQLGDLLDVGCGAGVLLTAASERWRTKGVELCAWAAREARERFGLDVFEGTVEEAGYPADAYDAVTMLDVIEHLPNPRETVAEIHRVLRPGGVLFVLTPDLSTVVSRLMGSWWWGLRPAHLYYFSRANLVALLERSGFEVKAVRYWGRRFTLGYWISRLHGYAPRAMEVVGRFVRAVRLDRLPLYLNTLDSVGVVAVKSGGRGKNEKGGIKGGKKIVAVLPAYNAEKTLERTLADIPKNLFDAIILVDDASQDGTVALAHKLGGLRVIVHEKNKGYGGNQKTCYKAALEVGADVVVMIHPDYQYDPTLAPDLVAPILAGQADCVLGSRMMRDEALKGRMPVWKYVGNKLLTWIENAGFGARFSEYHTGYRAFHKNVLSALRLELNSDGFVFDQEMIAQMLAAGYRIAEVPIPTRYFKEASSVSFVVSVKYGLQTLVTVFKFFLHHRCGIRFRQFMHQTAPLTLPSPPQSGGEGKREN